MAKQTLQTVITLSGQVDNSFGVLGQRIMALGSQIDGLSQKVIEFGKESIEQYVRNDDVMREVQALGEYDGKTIQTLNEYNRSIAQTSKYIMQQAGQAEVMMAQLGLNMEQTRTLMPTVMNLATAANIELADSLDYLYYTLNALGEPMSYADTLADQMSKTAAISAADIDTLGQSMQRLGSGAKFFAGGSEEILAILGGISQFGSDMQGWDAGTQLRNFMLTLLAPTKSKDELISSLRVTEEEWAEFESYMDDAGINVTDTAAAMNELGLSVYDSATGELKPAIQIIGELDAALSTLSEAEKNKMLGNLFGKRTTTTALNLIESLDTIIQYQEEIEKGSEGYTQSMADTMEGGLGGSLRKFNAALDAFKVTVGERLAPQVENITDSLTGFINSLTNMDDDKLDALISGATGIAALGPGLLLAGGAFRLIGFAMTPIGAATTALVALTAAAGALNELAEADFESNFGDMELDAEALSSHIQTLGADFEACYAKVNEYSDALDSAVESYKTASSTFSSNLLTHMLTGATLSEQDKTQLYQLGSDMHTALIQGIENSTARSMSYWEMLFGGEGTAENDSNYNDIIDLEDAGYKNALAQAESISQEFRSALTSAFDDGTISQEEYNELQDWMQEYNKAMAQAAAEAQEKEDYIDMQMLLHKAQTASFDSIQGMAQEIETQRDSHLAQAEEEFLREYYGLQYEGADAETLNAARSAYETHIQEYNAKYDDILMKMWESGIQQSELSEAYAELGNYADQFFAGEIQADSIHSQLKSKYGANRYAGELDSWINGDNISTQLGEYMARMVASLGGYEGISEKIDFYEQTGDTSSADELRRLYAMEQFINNFSRTNVLSDTPFGYADGEVVSMQNANREAFNAEMAGHIIANVEPVVTDSSIEEATGEQEIEGTVSISPGGAEAASAYQSEFQSSISSNPPNISVTTPSGYSDGANYAIGYQAALNANRPRIGVSSGSSTPKGYAEGGRATEASIFGEAGPEWAIPEEHSERTAELLNAAREGAGFTWPELIARNGGLNAGSGGGGRTLIYSPTIIASDAAGVEEKLLEDKERLNRWYAEKQLRDDLEVYA